MTHPLAGRSVLLLEVDSFVAGYVGAGLTGAGARLLGPIRAIAEARAILARDTPIDAAVFGIIAGTPEEWAFSEELVGRGSLVVFTSPASIELPAHRRTAPHLKKVFAAFQVVDAVASLFAAKTTVDENRGSGI